MTATLSSKSDRLREAIRTWNGMSAIGSLSWSASVQIAALRSKRAVTLRIDGIVRINYE